MGWVVGRGSAAMQNLRLQWLGVALYRLHLSCFCIPQFAGRLTLYAPIVYVFSVLRSHEKKRIYDHLE